MRWGIGGGWRTGLPAAAIRRQRPRCRISSGCLLLQRTCAAVFPTVLLRSRVSEKTDFLYSTFCLMSTSRPKPAARKRGRPPQHSIDRMRTRVWIEYLRCVSGKRSGYALETHIEPERVRHVPDGVVRPCKWDSYLRGTVPTRVKGKLFAVDAAEKRYPGSRLYFDAPAWHILKGGRPTSSEAVGLLESVGASFCMGINAPQRSRFDRLSDSEQIEFLDCAAECGTLDGLSALLIVLSCPELRSPRIGRIARWLLCRMPFAAELTCVSETLRAIALESFPELKFGRYADRMLVATGYQHRRQQRKNLGVYESPSLPRTTVLFGIVPRESELHPDEELSM